MTGDRSLTDRTELLRQAYLKIEKLQDRFRKTESARSEPIAVIGVGCRFPGNANNPEAFWQLMAKGLDAVGPIPSDRWDADVYFDPAPEVAGKMYTRNGAFLDRVDEFDAKFFGISPREAIKMDPQQRLLLEVVWEAFEHAGQALERLAGSATGVFIGMNADDYAHMHIRWLGLESTDLYFGSGVARSIAAGRIAYVLGLRGPSITIDTACSSSLVAVHLACQSLRDGESRMAVAGGVTLIIAPDGHVIGSQGRMLSLDGRCKTFDASADGYGRGEGCGIVVLKRLSDARADGDRILAQIRASAVNQDGRSGGLTAPNGIAQEEVLRKALAKADVKPEAVSYIETHGTGTVLGDPIEVQALGAVFGRDRSREKPLLIGSVKTNIGHLEAAAGVAGLIKAILAVYKGEIPPHLHFNKPNPHIAWDALPIEVVTRHIPWPGDAARRIAGVSSFGFSGTNVHLVVENFSADMSEQCNKQRPMHLLALSAKNLTALKELAGVYAGYFGSHPLDSIDDVCFTANARRSHFDCRLAVIGKKAEEIQEDLNSFRQGASTASLFHGEASSKHAPPLAFLFTGQGAQTIGMGRFLYDTQTAFRKTLDRCSEILRASLEKPLIDVLFPGSSAEKEARLLIDQTLYAQPALFALEYALAELWRSWGVEPSMVLGHSVGEYAAACIAGVFSLEDGLKLIAERGRLMQRLPHGGVMASVFADNEEVAEAIKGLPGKVSFAAMNGPENTVISGAAPDMAAALRAVEAKGIGYRKLQVSHAFHSYLMEPMLRDFEAFADTIRYAKPQIDMVSNVTGRLVRGDEISCSAYWCSHVLAPVRFQQSMQTIFDQGCRLFLEIGPHPTLLGMARQFIDDKECTWLPSLRRGYHDWEQILTGLAALYVRGVNINWNEFDRHGPRCCVSLPTYPFQRERYWLEMPAARKQASPASNTLHPLLGHQVKSPRLSDVVMETHLNADLFPFLEDHKILGSIVVPATVYLEMAQAAAVEMWGNRQYAISDFQIIAPIIIANTHPSTVQTIVTKSAEMEGTFEIYSLDETDSKRSQRWKRHASGTIVSVKDRSKDRHINAEDVSQLESRCAEVIDKETYYKRFEKVGVDYGPAFRAIRAIRRRDGEVFGDVGIAESLQSEAHGYLIHPTILDACFQLLGAAMPWSDGMDTQRNVYMPVGLERYLVCRHPVEAGWCHGSIREAVNSENESFTADIRLFDRKGRLTAEISGLHLKLASRKGSQFFLMDKVSEWLYEPEWQPLEQTAQEASEFRTPERWLIFADQQGVAESLARLLLRSKQSCTLIYPGTGKGALKDSSIKVNPDRREDYDRLFKAINDPNQTGICEIVYF